jgi:hypothetical protein
VIALFSNDIVAKINALITNVDSRAGYNLSDLFLGLAAKRTHNWRGSGLFV